jgi:hypothetical protein
VGQIESARGNRNRGVAIWFGPSVCGACLAGLIWLATRFFDAPFVARDADRAERAYKAAGLPWEAKDLAPNPPVKDADNAAPLIATVIKNGQLEKFSGQERELYALVRAGKLKEAETRLAQYQDALRSAELASMRPHLDFKRDWDLGANLLFEENAVVRSLVKLLCIQSELEAAQQKTTESLQTLEHAWLLAHLPRDEPAVLSMLASINHERFVLASASRCATSLQNDRPFLEALDRLLADSGPPLDLVWAMKGEAYMCLANLRNLDLMRIASNSEDVDATRPPEILKRTGLPSDMQAKAFAVRFMQMWTEGKPILDRFKDDPEGAGKAWNKLAEKWEMGWSMTDRLNAILFPSFGGIWASTMSRDADILVNRALISAFLKRLQTGTFPSRIEGVGGAWIDPFTKTPLRIKRAGESIRIYSLGPDRKDDAGIAKGEVRGAKGFDIVAMYPPRNSKPK